MEFLLDLCHAIGRVVWVGYVVFVYPHVTACSLQHQVDNLSHGFGLVLVEARDPLCCDVFQPIAAGKYVG